MRLTAFTRRFRLTAAFIVGISSSAFADEPPALPIPPLLESEVGIDGVRRFHLIADEGRTSFAPGRMTRTLGYNGTFLGPTIRVSRGEDVLVRVENRLDDPTTLHWHGADVPAEADGGPHQIIAPGAAREPAFTVRQPAATLWYHPHFMGTTARQVYEGLAGLFIIDDDVSRRLELPDDYGVDDVPLILQDRRFDSSGRFAYRPAMPDVMHGYFGNEILVNGAIGPALDIRRGPVRFRVLNGSNSTILRLSFAGAERLWQVASDGGFLPSPVGFEHLILSPGERAEVVLDLSQAGDSVVLAVETNDGKRHEALDIRPFGPPRDQWTPPEVLADLDDVSAGDANRTRSFVMRSGMGARMTINGKLMDMDRVDERVRLGDTEIWDIQNGDGGGMMGGMMNQPHNFHVHAVQFRILDINGRDPPPGLSGWKDTVLLWPGDRVRIIARFASYRGLYMYHCHLLEHEDNGMMGQFLIE